MVTFALFLGPSSLPRTPFSALYGGGPPCLIIDTDIDSHSTRHSAVVTNAVITESCVIMSYILTGGGSG